VVESVTQTAAVSERDAMALLSRFQFPSKRWYDRLGQLSGGERRRIQLLQVNNAITTRPSLCLFEPLCAHSFGTPRTSLPLVSPSPLPPSPLSLTYFSLASLPHSRAHQVLARAPNVLLLDEPSNDLDLQVAPYLPVTRPLSTRY